ncbi:MAG: cytochrome-c peroxidase [Bacteroidetes bacterium]|nr:MAG: cytochrome-c peroxidase [Bacteroidota bacterium]
MKKLYLLPLFSLVLVAMFTSCVPDDVQIKEEYYYPEELAVIQQTLNLPAEPLNYNKQLPAHIARAGLFVRPINKDLATLGRVLFYDKKLSVSGEVSCASCHIQDKAFADTKARSNGVNGNQTDRNSLALGSVVSFAAYYGTDAFGSFGVPFMWDNRFGTARDQAKAAFTSEKEMGLSMSEIVNVVNAQDYYKPLFRRAFGTDTADEDKILSAVAEFVDGLGTFNTKFDQEASKLNDVFNLEQDFPGFTDSENRGKLLYLTNCSSCHSANFGRPAVIAANNGLDSEYSDKGIGGVTNNLQDMDMFKVPTLRNVAVSGPYMHDGRFETLEEVIDHYSHGIQDNPHLSAELREDGTGAPKRFNFSEQDKEDLIAFFNTLTDLEYAEAERYSDPFKK